MTTTTLHPELSLPAPGTRRRRRAARRAAVAYVASWAGGLVLAPSAPDPLAATAAQLHAHATANANALLLQSGLVHGVAGLALLVLVITLPDLLPRHGSRALVRAAGAAAVVASWTQTALMWRLVTGVDADPMATTAGWFQAINRVDSLKLLLLGVVVGLLTAAAATRLRRGLTGIGMVLAAMLPVSGASFLGLDGLYVLLYLSLPLLLTWAVWFTFAVTRPVSETTTS